MQALLLASMVACGPSNPPRAPRAAPPDAATWQVATYNVNFGLDGDEATWAAATGLDTDLLVLQESTPWWHDAAADQLADRYPHQHVHYEGAADGMAMLSRHPIDVVVLPPQGDGWFCSLLGLVESPLGPVQVLSVHLHPPLTDGGLPSPFTAGIRAAEIEALLTYTEPSVPLVVVGDFNEPAGGAALSVLARRGMEDDLAAFSPGAHTWSWQIGGVEVTRQLDHVVSVPRLEALSAHVVDAGWSDHLPVSATYIRRSDPPPPPRVVRWTTGS